jgi:hypothetical protein
MASLGLQLSSVSISAERLKLQFPGISAEDVKIHFIFGKMKNTNEDAKPPGKLVPPGELDP